MFILRTSQVRRLQFVIRLTLLWLNTSFKLLNDVRWKNFHFFCWLNCSLKDLKLHKWAWLRFTRRFKVNVSKQKDQLIAQKLFFRAASDATPSAMRSTHCCGRDGLNQGTRLAREMEGWFPWQGSKRNSRRPARCLLICLKTSYSTIATSEMTCQGVIALELQLDGFVNKEHALDREHQFEISIKVADDWSVIAVTTSIHRCQWRSCNVVRSIA